MIRFLLSFCLILLNQSLYSQAETIFEIRAQQLTGVTVTSEGRIFTNFPRWRSKVTFSVLEVDPSGVSHRPYPDDRWNSWQPGMAISDSVFVAVQSVVASGDELFVLDTRNPLFQGVLGAPKVFVFNLKTDSLIQTYTFDAGSFHSNSYINDLRIDRKRAKAYFTDSGNSGLIILDLQTGNSRRILDDHPSTSAETDHLEIDGKKWDGTVHSDGIAFNPIEDRLYYHALTAYTLYALPAEVLEDKEEDIISNIIDLGNTPAPDGMIVDQKGNLYMADLEHHQIVYRDASGKLHVLLQGEEVKWADTFSIYDGYLYYTNSRIHEAGEDISNMYFQINRIPLPE